ncbi:hypothetical protein HCH_05800 [Hahella chejuensis KCTC 2396]|uniref:NERD domain-containing protein n=1 Tax=Hahella chejuensis (strain KCTC 2396) TaxID=349521 RepID=Q2SA73_HAHCH|nr:hypothetical protein HCH_05800 [Hahella chejuensis KCTC 2396]
MVGLVRVNACDSFSQITHLILFYLFVLLVQDKSISKSLL